MPGCRGFEPRGGCAADGEAQDALGRQQGEVDPPGVVTEDLLVHEPQQIDTHSLSYSFTVISKPGPGQPRCEVRGWVDEKPFLYYECGSWKANPLGPLGARVNATKVWAELPQTLSDVEQELRGTLHDVGLEQNKTRGADPPTLEAQMSCQQEADECREASWQFSIDGRTFLIFDSIHTTWTAVHPGAGTIKEKWESDQVLAQHLRKVSKGDCSHWLREFLKHWEKMPELAVAPTLAMETPQPPAIQPPAWFIPVIYSSIFIIIIIIIIPIVVIMKYCDQDCQKDEAHDCPHLLERI